MQESIYKTEKYRYTAIRLIKDKRGIFGIPQINISADFECEITKDKGLYYETDGVGCMSIREKAKEMAKKNGIHWTYTSS